MNKRIVMPRPHSSLFLLLFLLLVLGSCTADHESSPLNKQQLAADYFGNDSAWYLQNIPFFECSDKQIEQVYYYRWKLYKAHLRQVGQNQYVTTEFINHVAWDRDPFCTINAASMHHIYEGRWLKDDRYMDSYIDYLYHGGNDRRYSESVADATLARYFVNADSSFLVQQLDSMKKIFNDWSDHYDSSKNLYFIPAMPDATEYTIASIDASGGTGGFEGGDAFRPTLNSYLYGNAMAIARIASMKGDRETSELFINKAAALKKTIEEKLWNDSLQHFTDRYKIDNQYVHYWNFIRGRELAGMIPWYFNLPDDNRTYSAAWRQLTDTSRLVGAFGMRTNEPSYEYYFKQIIYFEGQRGSQWNGPSWPYQTSLALTAMANLLNNYSQHSISNTDYMKLLRQFTLQHYLPDGRINLVENYDPNLGGPIVYYYWSNHYNHSSFNNLVISGLCGIRPSASDTLDINPLADSSIAYFCLDDLRYHGHKLTVIFDRDGAHYKIGKGIIVFLDGKRADLIKDNGPRVRVNIGQPIIHKEKMEAPNYALNIYKKGYPSPSASVNNIPDSLFQSIDGRAWFFPEISNYWSTKGSVDSSDWYTIDFGKPVTLSQVDIAFYTDGKKYLLPDELDIEYQAGETWKSASSSTQDKLRSNTSSSVVFPAIKTSVLRLKLGHRQHDVAIVEVKCQ